ncbi:hypothetical protein [Opitutus terrae]|uniref:Uncharacterized protein n=1 Tax=Opitutus terrae (strain DSM 11246 / JCM 15787 / PB90-1) TaxID=452637 RepID=B2A008_OPITP|nr:hypothetical protein [Opitutus terrae]ACB77344.1 conserved hypothetical protein [Opitutus terrae PB90-1]
MIRPSLSLLLGLSLATLAGGVERATYNSAGALTALICDGAEVPVRGEFVVEFGQGVRSSLQPHDQRSPIWREGRELRWRGVSTFANSSQAQFAAAWTEAEDGVALVGSATAGGPPPAGAPAAATRAWPLLVESVDYVIDLPRTLFAGGRIDGTSAALATTRPSNPQFFQATVDRLAFVDAQQNWRLELQLDQPRAVTVSDRWENDDRSYRVRIRLGGGLWPHGESFKLAVNFKLSGRAHASLAHVTIDPHTPRYPFDGFGGNFCFNTQTPVADYLLENLEHAWARFELKGVAWDRERDQPGPQLVRDFELMQRVQRMGLPWIISLWRLPERYYSDPNQKPAGTFHRKIADARWPEFLDLIGSYLLHLKKNYGAEPDMFSFNEPDLGVDIGFNGPEHRDMIKRIGAHLESLGLKTRLLLGDTANPRDSHKYVLPTAADPAAMRYVRALSFHSWGNGTPQQYRAWGDVADWTQLPLLVGEAGVDPGSWRNRMFDSYAYGLREARQYQELLRDTRPQTLLFWEYTEDYGVVRVGDDQRLEPTGRFYFLKHFSNLSPRHGQVVASSSDQPDVLVSAFAKGDVLVVHLVNTGPACEAQLAGLPAGPWRQIVTTETEGFKEAPAPTLDAPLALPARSFTTLVRSPR